VSIIKKAGDHSKAVALCRHGQMTTDPITGENRYVDLSDEEFKALIEKRPSFAEICDAYKLMSFHKKYEVDECQAKPIF
jgi:hypothetical protein